MIVPAILILTGTAAAGKSTVADALVKRDARVVHVRALTTRARREDDDGHYDYVSLADFASLVEADDLFVEAAYGEHRYGVRRSAVSEAEAAGMYPVLTITPESSALTLERNLRELHHSDGLLSIFLDASDAELDRRIAERGGDGNAGARRADREWSEHATYIVENGNLANTVELVSTLWRQYNRGGVLIGRVMKLMLTGGMLLESANADCVEGASYDLRLGDEYFYGGLIRQLSSSKPILTIEPYDYAIVTSRERSKLPRDVSGRFDLSVGLFSQGVILSNGPQIDPGFRGNLFCLLFNTSSSPVLLKRGQHYATMEFHKLTELTDPYSGSKQGKVSIVDYLPANAATGAINDLKRELELLRSESGRLQTFFIAALSLMFAVIALVLSSRGQPL